MKAGSCEVLAVDSDALSCKLIRRELDRRGVTCAVTTDSSQAMLMLDARRVAVLVADAAMPGLTGLDLLRHSKKNGIDCKTILIAGTPDVEQLAEAISLGAYDFMTKPCDFDYLATSILRAMDKNKRPDDLLAMRAARAIHNEAEMKRVALEAALALASAVEAKDHYTQRHAEQVTYISVNLAEEAGLDHKTVESIRVAAMLHDIGKIGIPDRILCKPGKLSAEEFKLIMAHPVVGAEILERISVFSAQALFVRYHHENWDGTGYSEGLKGSEIPVGSRVIRLADSIDAMFAARSYKQPYGARKVVEELCRGAGTLFDRDLCAVAIQWCQSHPMCVPTLTVNDPAEVAAESS